VIAGVPGNMKDYEVLGDDYKAYVPRGSSIGRGALVVDVGGWGPFKRLVVHGLERKECTP